MWQINYLKENIKSFKNSESQVIMWWHKLYKKSYAIYSRIFSKKPEVV
jgi:hypothetical protein